MAPKRKHAVDDSTETTRTTRSMRSKTAASKNGTTENVFSKQNAKRGSKVASAKMQGDEYHDTDEKQPAKKSRTTKSARGKKPNKAVTTLPNSFDDESGAADQMQVDDEDQKVKQSKSSSTTHVEPPANSKSSEPPTTLAAPLPPGELYTPQRAVALFETYAEQDEPNVIGPEGFEKLCGDVGLSMEGSAPLLLAWQMEAGEMARISKEEWIAGTKALRISSPKQLSLALSDLDDLLVYGKPPIKKLSVDPYDRTRYWTYALDPKAAFHKFYQYCFVLVKHPSSKNIEMETATAFWSVLLGPRYPLMKEVVDFITEKGTFRAANKDLWNMMQEFCETVNPNLDNFEADGAWPTLLDEFASWKQSKSEI